MTDSSSAASAPRRAGVFVVGARGAVASCFAVGVCALRAGRMGNTGLVTARPIFDQIPLLQAGSLQIGGLEVQSGTLYESALRMAAEGVIPRDLVDAVKSDLDAIDARIVPGIVDEPDQADPRANWRGGTTPRTPREKIRNIQEKILAFKQSTGVDVVVVVNLASTEAMRPSLPAWNTLAEFERDLDSAGQASIPASTLHAFAAIDAGHPYINFTPSAGARFGALEELAAKRRVPHAGCDGKTGETLMKTVLAPLFRDRNLDVLAWEGYNMLGNGDGQTLADPAHRAGKIANKDLALRHLLGENPSMHTRVSIDYVPSLGDWKTAWDFIHFSGFFGTRMTLQFTWSGSDSALAAPLVIDLVRLVELAARRGESGALGWLAPFFKSPMGCNDHDFHRQNRMLEEYIKSHRQAAPEK